MSQLTKYKSKRHFKSTPEPKGVLSVAHKDEELIFTVQKHAASHLHYDFRLECDGVLKSWAVPKGPSLNPADKRLAIRVEDHPYDYWDFEGIIPPGNYGAGTVMLWDTGTYQVSETPLSRKEAQKIIRNGIEKGHLDFILQGEKLKGKFSLIKLKDKENDWLLFKKEDQYVSKTAVIEQDHSVKSNRSMEEIANKKNKESDPLSKLLQDAPRRKRPVKLTPMLSILEEEPFDKEGWLFEIKWDGYRALGYVNKNKVSLLSRNEKSFNALFPQVVEGLSLLDVDAVLDGEAVLLDSQGKPQFQLLQNFQTTQEGHPIYYVFDILYLNGHDLRDLPLIKRKDILKFVLSKVTHPHIRYCDHIENTGISFFKKVEEMNLEGIMAKDSRSPYEMKRSPYWKKIKTHLRQEVVIGGFTQPKGSRKKFGALLVGVYEGKHLVYSGHVGGGFTHKLLDDVFIQLQPLIIQNSPFQTAIKPNTPVTWVKPMLVCEVSFSEWTSEGIMRQPIFKGLRIDKNPKKVVRENLQ